jgi:hypothetical protein
MIVQTLILIEALSSLADKKDDATPQQVLNYVAVGLGLLLFYSLRGAAIRGKRRRAEAKGSSRL